MRNKNVDLLIEPAMEIVQRIFLRDRDYIEEEYESAISSFGSTMIQSGVLPACALYLKSKTKTKCEKARIIAAILELVKIQQEIKDFRYEFACKKEYDDKNNIKMMAEVIELEKNSNFKKQLINSTIALKLAIRTFNLKSA